MPMGAATIAKAAIGFNYYFFPESHAVKATVDLLMSFDETVPSLTAINGLGQGGATSPTSFLGQGDDTEFAIRAQASVLF